MKITKIHIENFRALENVTLDMEESLSIIVGKNNTGKTSIKVLLDKFLAGTTSFSINDINCNLQEKIKARLVADKVRAEKEILEGELEEFAVKLFLHIEYNDTDDLSNIATFITDLDTQKKEVIIAFAYWINKESYLDLLRSYLANDERFAKIKKDEKGFECPDALHILQGGRVGKFFKSMIFVTEPTANTAEQYKIPSEEKLKKKEPKDIKNIINYEFINAERESINPNRNQVPSSTLSKLADDFWRIYEEGEDEKVVESKSQLDARLMMADTDFTKIYKGVFQHTLDEIKKLSDSEESLTIESSLQARNLLMQNTRVKYERNATKLPEDYNGLGYMNLIEIMFKLILIKKKFEDFYEGRGADINLLFIEEPEAHLHPQMQVVFVRSIKKLLELENGKKVQTLLSTHSSHIAANTELEDFKYFVNTTTKGIVAKNLKSLRPKDESGEEFVTYKFIKQYITINRAEVFFADKLIFIEGDTERILLPHFMSLIKEEEGKKPLLKQNISIIESGAYAKEFEGLIKFLELKTLIITDIDYVVKKEEDKPTKWVACNQAEATDTSNATIKHFLQGKTIIQLKTLSQEERIVNNNILIAYQQQEGTYIPRTFDDAFIALNHAWLKSCANALAMRGAIKHKADFIAGGDFYDLTEKCLKSKTALAVATLYESQRAKDSPLIIPNYIKESLIWLSK